MDICFITYKLTLKINICIYNGGKGIRHKSQYSETVITTRRRYVGNKYRNLYTHFDGSMKT